LFTSRYIADSVPILVQQDHDNHDLGVVGSVELLSNRTLSSQPVCSLDFSPDKEGLFCCAAFDQTLRYEHSSVLLRARGEWIRPLLIWLMGFC